MIQVLGLPLSIVTTNPTWYEHVDLMQVVISLLLLYVAWTIKTYFKALSTAVAHLTTAVRRMREDFLIIATEHKKNHGTSALSISPGIGEKEED